MKFSVCIPVYNAEKYISKCIEAVKGQSFDDYEVILIDDGSTDRSGLICDSYTIDHENVHAFHQANQGLVTARSFAISHANGEYCVFVDADDYISPDALKILDGMIAKYDEPDCIIFGLEVISKGSRIRVSTEAKNQLILDKQALYRKVLSSDRYNSVCRKCTKTKILKLFDAKPYAYLHMGEDLIRSLDIYRHCNNVVFINNILYSYVMNDASLTHSVNPKNFQPSYLLYQYVFDFLKSEHMEGDECEFEVRTLYAQKLIRDVLQITRFELTQSDKIRLIKDVASNSVNILTKPVQEKELGRRLVIYTALKKGRYKKTLRLAQFECLLGKLSAAVRRLKSKEIEK